MIFTSPALRSENSVQFSIRSSSRVRSHVPRMNRGASKANSYQYQFSARAVAGWCSFRQRHHPNTGGIAANRTQKIFHAQRLAVAFRIRVATIVKFTFVLTERVQKMSRKGTQFFAVTPVHTVPPALAWTALPRRPVE